jgi:multiple sugar transport system substrate-binding protein
MKGNLWKVICVLMVAVMFISACASTATTAPAVAPTTAAGATSAPAGSTCNDADRVPISWSTIAGFYTDAMTKIVSDFEATHCVKVTVVNIDNSQLYDKQIIEAVGDTGAYDVFTMETAEKASFAENNYILPMDDYINAHAAEVDYADVAPILADITTRYKGHIWGLPYYTYTQGQFFRQDLFDDPTEKAAFMDKYGYELTPPQTWDQVRDMAEFFTRKAGETLKGETLTKDFYGIGLMAGPYQEIQDELLGMIIWKGSDVLASDGTITVNDADNLWALDFYVNQLLPFAPPAATTVTYDGVMNQMQDCQIAMTANFFLDQWPNAVKTEQSCPGAVMGIGEGIEKTVYVGAFLLGVSASSKHPQEAFDFVAYVGGKEAQTTFASMGGSSTRISVLSDPQFNTPESRPFTAHFAVLLKVFQNMTGKNSNLFYTPYGAKLYNSEGLIEHKAAVKEVTPAESLQELYDTWVQICGGTNCTVNR